VNIIFADKFGKNKTCTLTDLGGILPCKGDKIVWEYEPYPTVTEIAWNIDKKIIFIAVDK